MTAAPRPTDRVLVETFAVGERMCTLSLPLGASGLGTMAAEWSPMHRAACPTRNGPSTGSGVTVYCNAPPVSLAEASLLSSDP